MYTIASLHACTSSKTIREEGMYGYRYTQTGITLPRINVIFIEGVSLTIVTRVDQ